jgi:phthalate 4,5-cis-dihydrodiol dehydrogenase
MKGVGIIGAGTVGETHASAIAQLPDVRLAAACRTDSERLAAFCRRYDCAGYTDYRRMLEDPAVDIVVIATPHHAHTDIALRAAEARKAVLLEKPMAPSLPECDAILEAVEKAGVPLMVGFVSHFARAYSRAKSLIAVGEVGEVVAGSSIMAKTWMGPNRRSWHLDGKRGGGMWLTAGIHCLDRLTWLMNSRVARVSASLSTRFHDQSADDCGAVLLRFENGTVGTLVSVGYRTGAPEDSTRLFGTEGEVCVDYESGVSVGRAESWAPIPDSAVDPWFQDAITEEWRAFLQALSTNGPMPVSGVYARHIMAAAFAAETSSRTGRESEVR